MQVLRASPAIQAEALQQMMLGASAELKLAGCALAGGHSFMGAEAGLGLTITGHAAPADLMLKSMLKAGQRLVLTKPLGTALVLRGGMEQLAPAEWLEATWASMVQSNAAAAEVLRSSGVRACTDVTGFGLLGHVLEMADASKVCHTLLRDSFWRVWLSCPGHVAV